MKEIKVLAPTAILGYGFPEESFKRGLSRQPDFIAVDGGSTDPGPYYLGAGVSFTAQAAVKRDLQLMIKAGIQSGIPILIGTAGGSGADVHLQWTENIIREIVGEEELDLKLTLIRAEFEKDLILRKFEQGRVKPLFPLTENNRQQIEDSTRIVGQMGIEPIIDALETGVDVILAGRAYDPSVFAAGPVKAGFKKGPALHMGKILECAAIAADPGSGSDCMLGIINEEGFILEPMNPDRQCTVTSVAAHTLYEKSDPYRLVGPGGVIDLQKSKYKQLDERRVEVCGSRFLADKQYTIKLEGSRKIGHRTISIAGTRDPIMIDQIDEILEAVRGMVRDNFSDLTEEYRLLFKVYGKNGVMGELEPIKEIKSHELGIIIEVVATTQEIASSICSFARSSMLHYGYKGRVGTAGNLAFPYSPSDFKGGEVYEFCLNHLLEVDDPLAYFPVEIKEILYKEVRQ